MRAFGIFLPPAGRLGVGWGFMVIISRLRKTRELG